MHSKQHLLIRAVKSLQRTHIEQVKNWEHFCTEECGLALCVSQATHRPFLLYAWLGAQVVLCWVW